MSGRHRHIAQMFIAADVSQKFRSAFELGVVISIVMLLTALASSSFGTYLIRAQLSEAFQLTSTVRAEMVVYRAQHGDWPKTETELGNTTLNQKSGLGTFVDHLVLNENGSLSTFFGVADATSPLEGQQLTMRPMLVTGSLGSPVFWACAGYNPPEGFVPNGPDKTDIEIAHLPASCRNY